MTTKGSNAVVVVLMIHRMSTNKEEVSKCTHKKTNEDVH